MISRKKTTLIIAAVFFIAGITTLSHYGINWDTINHLPRGQAYLNYLLSGKHDYSNLPEWRPYWQNPKSLTIETDIFKNKISSRSFYESDATTFSWFMEHDGFGHPPVSDILSSVFNKILFGRLRLINDIDAYRVYGVFLAACLVGLVFWWGSKIYGTFAGLLAAISLALYPLFWSESHFNTEKDIPETAFWALMLFSIWRGVTGKSIKWLLLSGVFFGLALGTKFNILFSVLVVLPWLIFSVKKDYIKNRKLVLAALTAPFIGIGIFIASWPYLWPDIVGRIAKVIGYYRNIGLTVNPDARFLGPFNINTYPLQWILYTTPLIILILFVIGVLSAIYRIGRKKDVTSLLVLFWFIVPVARVSWPGTTVYGGIRQIMEFVPAMAILAGLGGRYLYLGILFFLKILKIKNSTRKILSTFLILACFIPLVVKLVRIHPNENAYFNPLISGLAGAREINFPSWGNTFGSAYRQGVSWINDNAETGAKVVLNYGLMPDIPTVWLRKDISFSNSQRSGFLRSGEYAIGLTYQGTKERSYYDSYLEEFLEPVYQAKVDGVAVLKVWKNDNEHLKIPWKETLYYGVNFSKEDFGLRFTLKQKKKLSRLEIDYKLFPCKELKSAFVRISQDGENWKNLSGNLPQDWLIPVLGMQPKDGKFTEPFVGQEAKYIDLVFTPERACLGQLKSYKVYVFD